MLPRFMVWFILLLTLIASGTPTRAAAPHEGQAQATVTERVYIPIVTSPTVSIASHRRYVDTPTSMVVVGEVINERSMPVYGVELEATFFDAAGQVIGTTSGLAMLEETKPNQRNPFRLPFDEDPARVARHEVRVVRWETTTPFKPQPLAIVSRQTRNNDGLEVFGEVRNAAAQALEAPFVVVTLYDNAGSVVDVLPGPTGRYEIDPNSTSVYSANSLQPSVAYTSYLVQGEGYVTQTPSPAFNLNTSNSQILTQGTNRAVVGEVLNSSAATAYDIEVEAKFYNASNQLVAVVGNYDAYWGDTHAGLGQTKTGQRNPFEAWLPNAPDGITRYELTATGYQQSYVDYYPLNMLSRSFKRLPDNKVEVTGQVRNDQAVTLDQAYVAVTFYDSSKRVLDVAFGEARSFDADGNPLPIDPGTQAAYYTENGRRIPPVGDYTVQAEGYVVRYPTPEQRMDTSSQRALTDHNRRFFQRGLEPVKYLTER